MKRKDFFKYIGVGTMAAAIGGCDFLNVVPKEKSTLDSAFQNKKAARNSLYSCYNYIPNNRALGKSISLTTSDELLVPYNHERLKSMTKGNYNSSNDIGFASWKHIYEGIRHCYIFLNRVDQTPGLNITTKTDYKAQVRFLIGYLNYYLIRMYGPIVVQKGVANINESVDQFKGRSTLDECVKFTKKILDIAAVDLPAKRSTLEYGQATSVMAKAVKGKLLLYAASPLFNGGGEDKKSFYTGFKSKDGKQLIPTTYDKEKWKKAADALKAAIDAAHDAGHKLYQGSQSLSAPLPHNPFERDLRFTFCDNNTKEIIFPGTRKMGPGSYQNNAEPSYENVAWNRMAPSLEIVEKFYTKNGLPISKDPHFDYENRYDIVKGPNGTTMRLNLNRESRFNAWICYHNSFYEIKKFDKNEVLCKFRKNDNCGIQNRSSNFSYSGYLLKKGVHPLSDNTTNTIVHYPWPILRLADLYLMYAEALIEYGKNFSTAKHYIDLVRQRAGIPKVDDAWDPIGGANDKKTLRSIIRRERTNELYLENQRFWDLRRWMKGEPLDKKLHGMNINGKTDKEFFQVTTIPLKRGFNSPRNYLMPIPIQEVNRNPNLVQNPGY